MTQAALPLEVARLADLPDRSPTPATAAGIDLVVIRWDDDVSVLYGRCLHRGALLADGSISGDDLICGIHNWDYRFRTGVSAYRPEERLQRFEAWIEDGGVWIDEAEVAAWGLLNPQPWDRSAYQGQYQDPHATPDEPHIPMIRELAAHGLTRTGHHGPVEAMGVPRHLLPSWDDIQVVTAQLAHLPLLEDEPVGTNLIIGRRSEKPLQLKIPLFVSDMSYGALSEEAKVALARGAELAGTAIASGEGGMLPEEQAENSRYLYELGSARFGFSWEKLDLVQAFHFKSGQGAKTGTGGHLPGAKVVGRIAEVRGLEPGTDAISPSRFPDWSTLDDYRDFAAEVRTRTGGIPIGFKLSAQHVEDDLDAALEVGVDYIILDGRGGGTGAAPTLFRDNISIPTMAGVARARRHLDRVGAGRDVTLIATGGLRTAADFAKAMALGADGIGLSSAAMAAIGCIGMRACNTNNCPVGIATQKPHLRDRLPVDEAAERLDRFLGASVELMKALARACGHPHLAGFEVGDLTTWKRQIADLTGIAHAGPQQDI